MDAKEYPDAYLDWEDLSQFDLSVFAAGLLGALVCMADLDVFDVVCAQTTDMFEDVVELSVPQRTERWIYALLNESGQCRRGFLGLGRSVCE